MQYATYKFFSEINISKFLNICSETLKKKLEFFGDCTFWQNLKVEHREFKLVE